MEKKVDSGINLLPGDDLEKAPLGKFLKWALTYGRYIVVITELIVLLVFFSRFKLDRDLFDLSDSINRKKTIIESSALFEEKVRRLQIRLHTVASLIEKTSRPSEYLAFLTASLPQGVTLVSLRAQGSTVTLSGTTISEAGIATLVSVLSKDSRVRAINVNNLNKDSKTNLLSFSTTISLWP